MTRVFRPSGRVALVGAALLALGALRLAAQAEKNLTTDLVYETPPRRPQQSSMAGQQQQQQQQQIQPKPDDKEKE